jgi:hypothetical protein
MEDGASQSPSFSLNRSFACCTYSRSRFYPGDQGRATPTHSKCLCCSCGFFQGIVLSPHELLAPLHLASVLLQLWTVHNHVGGLCALLYSKFAWLPCLASVLLCHKCSWSTVWTIRACVPALHECLAWLPCALQCKPVRDRAQASIDRWTQLCHSVYYRTTLTSGGHTRNLRAAAQGCRTEVIRRAGMLGLCITLVVCSQTGLTRDPPCL